MPQWFGPGALTILPAPFTGAPCVGCGGVATEELIDRSSVCTTCRNRANYWYFLMQSGMDGLMRADHVRAFATYLSAIREKADATSKSWSCRMSADRLRLITECH